MCQNCWNPSHILKSYDARGKEFVKVGQVMQKAVQKYLAYLQTKWLDDIQKVQLPTVINKEEISDQEFADIMRAMETAVVLGMTQQNALITALPQISVDIGINSDFVTNYIQSRTGTLISGIDESVRVEIQEIIDNAFVNGLSVDDIAKKITDEFFVFSDYRADLIAQMETANAYETGKLEQFRWYEKEVGMTGWKKALTQGDSAVRPEHQANADQGWIKSTELFSGTGSETAPFGFNCRCTVVLSLVNPDTGSIF